MIFSEAFIGRKRNKHNLSSNYVGPFSVTPSRPLFSMFSGVRGKEDVEREKIKFDRRKMTVRGSNNFEWR